LENKCRHRLRELFKHHSEIESIDKKTADAKSIPTCDFVGGNGKML